MSMEYIGLALIQNVRTAFDDEPERREPEEADVAVPNRRALRARLGMTLIRVGSAMAGPRAGHIDVARGAAVAAPANTRGWTGRPADWC